MNKCINHPATAAERAPRRQSSFTSVGTAISQKFTTVMHFVTHSIKSHYNPRRSLIFHFTDEELRPDKSKIRKKDQGNQSHNKLGAKSGFEPRFTRCHSLSFPHLSVQEALMNLTLHRAQCWSNGSNGDSAFKKK